MKCSMTLRVILSRSLYKNGIIWASIWYNLRNGSNNLEIDKNTAFSHVSCGQWITNTTSHCPVRLLLGSVHLLATTADTYFWISELGMSGLKESPFLGLTQLLEIQGLSRTSTSIFQNFPSPSKFPGLSRSLKKWEINSRTFKDFSGGVGTLV